MVSLGASLVSALSILQKCSCGQAHEGKVQGLILNPLICDQHCFHQNEDSSHWANLHDDEGVWSLCCSPASAARSSPDDDQPSDLMTKWINNQWSRLISSCPTGELITLQVSVRAVGFDNRCRAVRGCVFFFLLVSIGLWETFCDSWKAELTSNWN